MDKETEQAFKSCQNECSSSPEYAQSMLLNLKNFLKIKPTRQISIPCEDFEQTWAVASGVVRSFWIEKRLFTTPLNNNLNHVKVTTQKGMTLGELEVHYAQCGDYCGCRYVVLMCKLPQEVTTALFTNLEKRFNQDNIQPMLTTP